jgi:glycerol-3-phosphate acyltransferase PlsY
MDFIIFGLIAYVLGSIPTSVWIGKVYYDLDIRKHGSFNAGATNTFRVLGKKPGIIVLLIDVAKGSLAVLLPQFISDVSLDEERLVLIQILTAIMAVFGHVFPLFANFDGGKGVATSLGVIIGLHPPAALICLATFLIVFILSKYVSLGAIVASFMFPSLIIFVFQVESVWLRLFSVILAALVIITHKKNIRRIINGDESKMNLFKK